MPFESKDIRIVKGDASSVSEAVKAYLDDAGFKVDGEHGECVFKASNREQSPLKLYLSVQPQIVHFQIERKADEEVQVTMRFGLFFTFRIYFYSILTGLLLAYGIALKAGKTDGSLVRAEAFYNFSITLLFAIVFVMLALFFFVKILETTPYENFAANLYKFLKDKGFGMATVLKANHTFPDILKGLTVFSVLTVGFLIEKGFLSTFNGFLASNNLFFPALLIVLSLLLLLVLIMRGRPALATRLMFCLAGIGLCIPLAVYSNAPLLNLFTRDIVEKVDYANSHYLKKIDEAMKSGDAEKRVQAEKILPEVKKIMRTGTIIVFAFWLFVGLIILILLMNTFRLPIKIVESIDWFNTRHSESLYHRAHYPEETTRLFSLVVLLLWMSVSVANLAGLFFSLSILEKLIFGAAHVFRTGIGEMFFDDTKILLSQLIPENTNRLHIIIMLAYSLPLTLIFTLVIGKNALSFVRSISLLRHTEKNEEAAFIKGRIERICRSAGVSLPVVRIERDDDINAETQYLGFPFYKNILTVTEGAYNELKSREDELDGLLAHEVWHQKKHTFTRRLLALASDYTLFGNGFLAVFQNAYKIEKDADRFAVKWLKEKLKSRDQAFKAYESLLTIQKRQSSVTSALQSMFRTSAMNLKGVNDEEYREKLLTDYATASKAEKLWFNLKTLFRMYFGTGVISYFHPPDELRKEWIKS